MMYTVVIPNWHPTHLNKLINSHWSKANRLKRADAQMIGAYLCKAKIPKATGKRKVEIELILGKGQRAADPDSYPKSALDGLVKLGYLKDDNRQWLELEPVKFSRGEMATVFRFEDCR